MSASNANSSGSNNQQSKNNTNRYGRGQRRGQVGHVRGVRGHGRSVSSSCIIHNNNKKGQIKEFRKNVSDVSKSEQFEQTMIILAYYVGNKYSGAAIHVIKNHIKKIINYSKYINETIATRKEQLIYEESI